MRLQRGIIMLTCVAVAALIYACGDRQVMEPSSGSETDPRFSVSAAPPLAGCSLFDVLVRGRDSIQVDVRDGGCGPVRPVLVGRATYDRVRGKVILPLAIQNGAQGKVKAPALIMGWADSLRVLAPPGLAQNGHTSEYIAFVAADSVRPDELHVWRYDGRLAPGGEPQTLPPGGHSAVRDVTIAIKDGVAEFTAVLTAGATRAAPPVPAVAPDTFPDWVYGDSMFVELSEIPGRVVKDIVLVNFVPSATQSERQSAIDLIDGEVVGGDPTGGAAGGTYFVQLPHDGTGRRMLRAVDQLTALPQVAVASLEYAEEPFYLKPHDGGAWDTWQVLPNPPSAGPNWGLEAINAPLAWGCATGSAETVVGVVDNGFHRVADLAYAAPSYGIGEVLDSDHGTRVASVLAASGDNRQGMTGTMWRSALRAYEASRLPNGRIARDSLGSVVSTPDLSFRNVYAAAMDGATIINFSRGLRWPRGYRPQTHDDSLRVTGYVGRMSHWLGLLPPNRVPLLVVAAGNDGLDVYWAGSSHAVRLFPQNTIVVAGSDHGFGLMPQSNHNVSNHFVEVAAPGLDLGMIDGFGHDTTDWGTSYSAPLVAGVAGLLKSFDPRLAPADMKQYIVAGAVLGGRSAGGVPVLNAWEALKLAATRLNAPLCGNEIWQQNSHIVAARGITASQDLFQLTGPAAYIAAMHGGHRMRVQYAGYALAEFALINNAWSQVPVDPGQSRGGTFMSAWSRSHDGDTTVYARSGDGYAQVFRTIPGTPTPQLLATIMAPASRGDTVCAIKTADDNGVYSCSWNYEWSFQTNSSVATAYSPLGDQALVLVSTELAQYFPGDYSPCKGTPPTDRPPPLCREFTFNFGPVETRAYAIDLIHGGSHELWRQSGRTTRWAGIAEGGYEIVTTPTRRTSWATFRLSGPGAFEWYESGENTTCEYTFRAGDGSVRRTVQSDGCESFAAGTPPWGTGTIAGKPVPVTR